MSEQFPVHATAQAVTGARPVFRGAGRAVTFPVPVLAEPRASEPVTGPELDDPALSNGSGEARESIPEKPQLKADSRGGENDLSGGSASPVAGLNGVATSSTAGIAPSAQNDVHSNGFQSKLDPFFTGKHTVREAWKKTKRVSYWLDYCGRRY